VQVEAAAVNASDRLYISGQYFLTPRPRSDVGAEGVGRVSAVCSGVDDSIIGKRVVLLPTHRHGWGVDIDQPHHLGRVTGVGVRGGQGHL
jgi:NADPH:quinone reductase-like Zn-dependent oxidoreductase